MKRGIISLVFSLVAALSFSQTTEANFVPENFLHIKLGTTMNLHNTVLFKSLNDIEDGNGSFTPAKQLNVNPLAEVVFERQMKRHFGLMVYLGFTQTRSTYMYDNNTTFADFHQKGLVTANVPNVGLMPVFYVKNTRFMIGSGLYKYYYSFRPMDAGYIHFNLNLEGMMIYNRASVAQTFNLGSHNLSLTASYFGFLQKFDHGFQLALGLEL